MSRKSYALSNFSKGIFLKNYPNKERARTGTTTEELSWSIKAPFSTRPGTTSPKCKSFITMVAALT